MAGLLVPTGRVGPQQISLNRSSQFARELACWLPIGNRASWGTDTIVDPSRSNHGTLVNTATVHALNQRAYVDLDGSDDRIDIPFLLDPNLGGFSCFCWVYPPTSLTLSPNQNRMILQQEGSSGRSWLYWGRESDNDHHLATFVGGAETLGTTDLISPDLRETWIHLGFTVTPGSGSQTVTLYVNGENDGSSSQDPEAEASGAIRWGAHKSPTSTNKNWIGRLDDLRIYTRCLPDGEVAQLYKETLDGTYGSLAAPIGPALWPSQAGAAPPAGADFPYNYYYGGI